MESLFAACFIAGLAALGAAALLRPRRPLRYGAVARAFGLSARARTLLTRGAGGALLAVSLVLLPGFFRSLTF